MGLRRYEKYKESGVPWIGEIPEHWEVKKLKYVAKLQCGYAFKSNFFRDYGIPIIRIGDLTDEINWDNCKKIPEELDVPEIFKSKKNDTLIALSGATIGKTCFISNHSPPKAYINQRVAQVNFKNKLLYFYLTSDFFQKLIKLTGDGSAQENISIGQIENIELAVSSNESEQTAIAEYLERKTTEIDAKIEKIKKSIELLKEYRTTLISEVVTGKIKVI